MGEEETSEKNEYELLRDEMNSQFSALKEAFEAQKEQDAETINTLKEANAKLNQALLKSAFTEQQTPPPEKTEEELYNEMIAKLFEKSKHYKSMM